MNNIHFGVCNLKQLSRKEREDKRKRYDILQSALEVFASKGFHGATMAEISQVSQYPLGTIYKFFSGKDQIFHDMVVKKGRELGGIFSEVFSRRELSVTQRLRDGLQACVLFCMNNRSFVRVYISERSRLGTILHPNLRENINAMHEAMIDVYEDLFKEGIDNGEFKGFSSREMAILFSGIINSTAWIWLTENEASDALKKRMDTTFAVFTRGVCTEKGRAMSFFDNGFEVRMMT